MNAPENHFPVTHGSLTITVPRDLFTGPECDFVDDKVKDFRSLISRRYPWLSEGSLDVLMNNARKEILHIIDDETGGRVVSKQMASKGKIDDAIKHLQKHLEEDLNDADSWYALGELLCKAGRVEEGYKAMNTGRSLFEKE